MSRIAATLLIALAMVMSYGLYRLKYEVEGLQGQAAALARDIHQYRRSLKVLRAEWAYLSRPDRLEALNRRYLGFAPPRADQFVGPDGRPLVPANRRLAARRTGRGH